MTNLQTTAQFCATRLDDPMSPDDLNDYRHLIAAAMAEDRTGVDRVEATLLRYRRSDLTLRQVQRAKAYIDALLAISNDLAALDRIALWLYCTEIAGQTVAA